MHRTKGWLAYIRYLTQLSNTNRTVPYRTVKFHTRMRTSLPFWLVQTANRTLQRGCTMIPPSTARHRTEPLQPYGPYDKLALALLFLLAMLRLWAEGASAESQHLVTVLIFPPLTSLTKDLVPDSEASRHGELGAFGGYHTSWWLGVSRFVTLTLLHLCFARSCMWPPTFRIRLPVHRRLHAGEAEGWRGREVDDFLEIERRCKHTRESLFEVLETYKTGGLPGRVRV